MKRNGRLLLSAILFVSSTVAFSGYGQVEPWQLTDGTTTALVDVGSSMGMYQWSLGGENQLNQQWFWYRTTSGQQYSIDTIGARTVTRPSGNATLQSVYGAGSDPLTVTVSYTLQDQGLFQAAIDETIAIRNNTGGSLSLSFFQYSDFNLNGTAEGDVAYTYLSGAYQTEGASGISEGLILPDATAHEANVTGGTGSTLYKLQNLSNVNLTGNDYAEGDVTWAFQWDLTIPAGQTVDIIKTKWVWSETVPEPSALGLIALGLGVARRRQ
jgi:hypothetical protein